MTPRDKGTNPRAQGTNPRALGTNPRATRTFSEAAFQSSLIKWAKTFGWRVHAERPAQYTDGRWATHVQGDAGWPDLVLARPPRLIFAELKVGRNKLSDAQLAWWRVLTATSTEVYEWRPEDWSRILVVLSK